MLLKRYHEDLDYVWRNAILCGMELTLLHGKEASVSTATTKEGIYQVAAYVDEPTYRELQRLKEASDRSMSYVAGQLIKNGLPSGEKMLVPTFRKPSQDSRSRRKSAA